MPDATSEASQLPEKTQVRKKYVRAVGPRLQILFFIVLGLIATIGVNSVYMASITALEWFSQQAGSGASYQNHFYLSMFALHLALGLVLIVPFLVFGLSHMVASWNRRNRRAVRIGYTLLLVSIILLVTGVLLVRLEGIFDLKNPIGRSIVYWLHVLSPLVAIWLYWLHRLAGPRIKWHIARRYAAATIAVVALLVIWQMQDPRDWFAEGPKEGAQYFEPSLVKTANGKFLSADVLMMDEYCLACHKDAYEGWFHSAHHFSSFNNPPYRASVRETRRVALERDGSVQASRWCAGCHDPVPFLSGAFDDKDFDDVRNPTAHAGITCTVCHAMTHINSNVGNGDYTIEEPLHYPFATSENSFLRYVNHQLVKAKPSFHKQTFLKPFHKTAEFCSVCHKVHLPKALTHYKEFLRGQNSYDPYLLSGVSGVGARSFYYPKVAEPNCNGCHMPLHASNDFGAKVFDDSGKLKIHDHLFPSANSALPYLRGDEAIIESHREFLEGVMRVDIFGLKQGDSINGQLSAPLRPQVPALTPGKQYLLETVIRTLKMGHMFTQGTADSNEIWMDVTVTSGNRVIGRSGGMDEKGETDRWSHFVNVFMLDRNGNRINRRNAQDIFVPLYNNQIPPGAGQIVHYLLQLPDDIVDPVKVNVKLQYRKFDWEYMRYVAKDRTAEESLRGQQPDGSYVNDLPIITLAEDEITFPVAESGEPAELDAVEIPVWQRWNDYGIGLLLEGRSVGSKGELRQAEHAFQQVEALGQYHGPLNLARVYFAEGRLDEAVDALNRAASFDEPAAPHWTLNWLTGMVNKQQGYLDNAIKNLRSVLETSTTEMQQRGFDFGDDYVVINELGQTLFERAKQYRGPQRKEQREALLRDAVEQFQQTLKIDSENVTAHYNLGLLYAQLGEDDLADQHRQLHTRYKPDDNARDRAIALARGKYPHANHAAEAVVIYSLQRDGAPGLPPSKEQKHAIDKEPHDTNQ